MIPPRQCAVLVGGLGTRLGSLTARTPKPLLDCAGKPFLYWILRELCRYGIENVILLAGHKADCVQQFAEDVVHRLPRPLKIMVSIEPQRAGTGGALFFARELLEDTFLLINGDSWLDTPLAGFLSTGINDQHRCAHILLRAMDDVSRYGSVELSDGIVQTFREKQATPQPGLINAGVCRFHKSVLDFVSPVCSMESDVLPKLVQHGLLSGQVGDGYFIDIGIPADYARAQDELPRRLRRPAVFFDRDGVLNEDTGWVGSIERFKWMEGAKEAVAVTNRLGRHVFVVTNQAGVARGLYLESDVATLHRWMQDELLACGATIDDYRYCPHHPNAALPEFRVDCPDRKPQPGMINALARAWDVDMSASFLIGNSQSDIEAAERAGIRGQLYNSGNLAELLLNTLQQID